MKFSELNLSPEILAGLDEMGYEGLAPVQEQTFPHVLAGKDMIARAETGSGKTAACAVPIIQMIDPQVKAVQALILVPTRELALQYVEEIANIAKHTDLAPFAVYGGFSMGIQTEKLAHGVHILVATPGRLIDLLYNSPLSLSEVRTFVLDEADEMLNMGFIDDVEFIISCLVHQHQTLLFSATMPSQIKRLARKHLKDPITVELNIDQIAPQNLEHCFQQVEHKRRFDALVKYLKDNQPGQAIIFCNSRVNVDRLISSLRQKIKSVECIHGGFEQSKRTSLFNRFRKKKIKTMVATDVASRGLDFSHVTHVINYDFPRNPNAYTHRTGRTARMGRSGIAMTFVTRRDLQTLKVIIDRNRVEPIWHDRAPNMRESSRQGRPRFGRPQRKSRSRR